MFKIQIWTKYTWMYAFSSFLYISAGLVNPAAVITLASGFFMCFVWSF